MRAAASTLSTYWCQTTNASLGLKTLAFAFDTSEGKEANPYILKPCPLLKGDLTACRDIESAVLQATSDHQNPDGMLCPLKPKWAG